MMGSVFYFVSKAPQWIDQQDAPHYNDMISGDKGIKLVSAYFDPWLQTWVRCPGGMVDNLPSTAELDAFYATQRAAAGPAARVPELEPGQVLPTEFTVLAVPRTNTKAPLWVRSPSTRSLRPLGVSRPGPASG